MPRPGRLDSISFLVRMSLQDMYCVGVVALLSSFLHLSVYARCCLARRAPEHPALRLCFCNLCSDEYPMLRWAQSAYSVEYSELYRAHIEHILCAVQNPLFSFEHTMRTSGSILNSVEQAARLPGNAPCSAGNATHTPGSTSCSFCFVPRTPEGTLRSLRHTPLVLGGTLHSLRHI